MQAIFENLIEAAIVVTSYRSSEIGRRVTQKSKGEGLANAASQRRENNNEQVIGRRLRDSAG